MEEHVKYNNNFAEEHVKYDNNFAKKCVFKYTDNNFAENYKLLENYNLII